jgi:hypothetical protein
MTRVKDERDSPAILGEEVVHDPANTMGNSQSSSSKPDIKQERDSPSTEAVDLTKSLSPDSELEIAGEQPVRRSTRQKRKKADSRSPITSTKIKSNELLDWQPHLPEIPLPDRPEETDANQEDLDLTPERDLRDIPSYHGSSPNERPDWSQSDNLSGTIEEHPGPQALTETHEQTQTESSTWTSPPAPRRRQRRSRCVNAHPTRHSRRLRGGPPEFPGLEPVRRKRRSQRSQK